MIGVLLTQWLATIAPDSFTHGDARKALGALTGTPLTDAERAALSVELANRVAGGWLSRSDGTAANQMLKKNYYQIMKRPDRVSQTSPEQLIAYRKHVPARPRPPRQTAIQMFEAVLRAFSGMIKEGAFVVVPGGVRIGKYEDLFLRTATVLNSETVDPTDIKFELADARAFGLYWLPTNRREFCWRPSTERLFAIYNDRHPKGISELATAILNSARQSRSLVSSHE